MRYLLRVTKNTRINYVLLQLSHTTSNVMNENNWGTWKQAAADGSNMAADSERTQSFGHRSLQSLPAGEARWNSFCEVHTATITTTTILWQLCRPTCISRHPQLSTGGFCWSKLLLLLLLPPCPC